MLNHLITAIRRLGSQRASLLCTVVPQGYYRLKVARSHWVAIKIFLFDISPCPEGFNILRIY